LDDKLEEEVFQDLKLNSDAMCEIVEDFNPEALYDRMFENLTSGNPKF
jgi:hypothetical protein